MDHQTNLLLDDYAHAAVQQLARRYQCSNSEAIRRAVLGHRDSVLGIPPERRAERVQLLHRLFELFEGHDAAEEIRRLKEQDEGF